MGRPLLPIDRDTFSKLCAIQCTEAETASVLGVSVDTLGRWCKKTFGLTFAEVYKKESAGGRASLRRAQFAMAQKSPVMAIWLGKQILGQRDLPEHEESGEMAQMLEFMSRLKAEAKPAAAVAPGAPTAAPKPPAQGTGNAGK